MSNDKWPTNGYANQFYCVSFQLLCVCSTLGCSFRLDACHITGAKDDLMLDHRRGKTSQDSC